MSKISEIRFKHGPRDGEVLSNDLNIVPDIIDGEGAHWFGDNAYAVEEIDHDRGIATYGWMKLINYDPDQMDSGEAS